MTIKSDWLSGPEEAALEEGLCPVCLRAIEKLGDDVMRCRPCGAVFGSMDEDVAIALGWEPA